MREQSTFFEQRAGDRRIVVVKTYDAKIARGAFDQMTQEALETLGASLDLDSRFDATDIPPSHAEEYAEFLWEAVEDGAREDWNTFSYFVVREEGPNGTAALFVASDWPSAEAFAKSSLPVIA